MPEPFAHQLKRVRRAKGFTLERLAFRAQEIAEQRGERGISRDAIAQLEGKPRRRPTLATVLLLGEALEASDDEFPAYALARARALLDETVVGQEQALANLQRVRAALEHGDVAEVRQGRPRVLDVEMPEIRRRADAAARRRRRRPA